MSDPSTDRRFVKPSAKLLVPMPDGEMLPPHGAAVSWSSYWQRRLDAREVEPTDEKSVAAGERRMAAEAARAASDEIKAVSEGDAK